MMTDTVKSFWEGGGVKFDLINDDYIGKCLTYGTSYKCLKHLHLVF